MYMKRSAKEEPFGAFREKATEEQIKTASSGRRTGALFPVIVNHGEFILIDDQDTIDNLAQLKYNMNKDFPPAEGQTLEDVDKAARFQQKAFANSSRHCRLQQQRDRCRWLACRGPYPVSGHCGGVGSGIVAIRGNVQAQAEKASCNSR